MASSWLTAVSDDEDEGSPPGLHDAALAAATTPQPRPRHPARLTQSGGDRLRYHTSERIDFHDRSAAPLPHLCQQCPGQPHRADLRADLPGQSFRDRRASVVETEGVTWSVPALRISMPPLPRLASLVIATVPAVMRVFPV